MDQSIDWFSWLSKTCLEESLVYEYGMVFSRNELEEDDITYFNHEFLQSMGISVGVVDASKYCGVFYGGYLHTPLGKGYWG
ncbi:hypothetical protein SSX86_007813 [Deinandra increscens subsp. villosa]|uniref:Uncharacterized protein n=1 Tax=Deinandra increscens subsp. villosa TaxID=3103831 RepID=A0AAP0DEK0_9ASTR